GVKGAEEPMNAAAAESARATERDPRWAAVLARDPEAAFFYSVETTGVYSRPSFGARRARPENVRFRESGRDAAQAGFRPCKRCRPGQPAAAEQHAAKVAAACRRLEPAGEAPALGALAAEAGMSASHFRRVFKAVTGLTPRQYAKG